MRDLTMKIEVHQKDGRLWARHIDERGMVHVDGPTRVQLVRDDKLEDFRKVIREAESGMLRCKGGQRVFIEPGQPTTKRVIKL